MTFPFPPVSWDGIDDVVIVGGGFAGLFCALELAPRPVTILSGTPIGDRASFAGRHGLPATPASAELLEAQLAETLAAGAGLAEKSVAAGILRDWAQRSGAFPWRDGATGPAVIQELVARVRHTPSIRVMEGYVAEQVRLEGPYVTGLVARDRRGGLSDRLLFSTRAIVLASGGLGHLFERTSNPPEARGEGLALAARAGALVADMEFVEFHPTLDIGADPMPLAGDDLLRDGARLVDGRGRSLVQDAHADGDTARRPVLARAVHTARIAGDGAYLDCRGACAAALAEHNPQVQEACIAAGIDPVREPIPVAAAAHYHLGGVHVDAAGRTTLDGLWAIGEVACTGMHGAARLPANARIETIVLAARAARDIKGQMPNHRVTRWTGDDEGQAPALPDADGTAMRRLRATMSAHVGPSRDEAGLLSALETIRALAAQGGSPSLRNALVAARLVTTAALRRAESRGVHWRSDFPATPQRSVRAFGTLEAADAPAARPLAPAV